MASILAVTTSSSPPQGVYLIAPRRGRRRRTWLERQRGSKRGRFELAIVGGGAIALFLAAVLPGLDHLTAVALLFGSGLCMTIVTIYSGLIPALAAAFFAPLVIALTDPMWTLGATLADFNLGNESAATFGTFAGAAMLGAIIRKMRREQREKKKHGLWRAQPHRREAAQSDRKSGKAERPAGS